MKKFGSESGQVLIFVALSMTILFGCVGLATDVGVLLHEKREAQTAADSAAIAGALEAVAEGEPTAMTSSIQQAAWNDAALNGFTNGSNGAAVTVSMAPNISVSTFNQAGYIQATVTQTMPDLFMRVFGRNFMNVSATAVATENGERAGCVYVQNPGNAANPAVYMNGNSLIVAAKCGISINGNLTFNGNNATIEAGFLSVTGTISSPSQIDSPYTTGVPPQPDPLAQLSNPANQPTVNGSSCTSPDGSTCYYDFDGGTLTGPLTLNPGVYYFDKPVTLSGAISGTGVMFYLAGDIPFDFDANGTLSLSPISTGTFPNVLIDAPNDGPYTTCSPGKSGNSGNAGELYFDFGSSTTTLNGIVYAPQAQLFEQDSGATLSFNTDLVIGNICEQSASLSINGLSGSEAAHSNIGLVY